ncbi:MAG: helix-turn-helix transcriptional regulator, partial [Bacteroidales bacterium]
SDKGTVMSYSVHGVEVMLINIKSNQELRVTRDIKAQQLFYPIMFSDSLHFEEKNDCTVAEPSSSLSTGIYFSNEVKPLLCKANIPMRIAILRVRKKDFLQFIPKEHQFMQVIRNNADYHFYELITSEIKFVLHKLFGLSEKPKIIRENLVYAYTWELFSLFSEHFFFKRNSNFIRISKHERNKLQEVRLAILDDISTPKTIHELTQIAAMSATKLRLTFKEVYGASIYQFYQRHRMDEAKQLLETGGKSVSDVAYTIGYNHLGYFTATFKKHFGVSPKYFIK